MLLSTVLYIYIYIYISLADALSHRSVNIPRSGALNPDRHSALLTQVTAQRLLARSAFAETSRLTSVPVRS